MRYKEINNNSELNKKKKVGNYTDYLLIFYCFFVLFVLKNRKVLYLCIRVHFSVEKRKSKDASHRCSASFAFIGLP